MMVADNLPGAKQAKRISENVNDYLSACQLGITLASLALGWLGEPAVASLIRPLLSAMGLPDAAISAIAVAIGFIIITALHIIVGELIPKSLAIFSTEKYARGTAHALVAFYYATYPIMWLFNSITNGVMRLLGHDISKEHDAYTDEEIKILVDESYQSGLLEETQYQYMDNIFELGEKDAEEIMTPRTDMVCLHQEDPLETNLAAAFEAKYTRYPVCIEDKDNIIGFVHIKDLYYLPENATALPIRPIEVVTESVPISKLLHLFQQKKTKIAVVVDEHGGTAGMVTMSDITAQIIGHMDDEYEHDDLAEVEKLADGHYICDGALSIDVFADMMEIEIEELPEYNTLGGFLLEHFDRIPSEGEVIHYKNLILTVKEMEAHRIIRIEVQVDPDYRTAKEAEECERRFFTKNGNRE